MRRSNRIKRAVPRFVPLGVYPRTQSCSPASSAQWWSSLTAVAVSPAALLALPLVTTARGLSLAAYFRNWDLPATDPPSSSPLPYHC